MSVTFSTEPSSNTALDVDSLLRPQLSVSARSSSGPDAAVLRVLCRGLASGLTPSRVRAWLLSVNDPDVTVSLSSSYRWHRLVRHARAAVLAESSAAGRSAEKFSVARVLVARSTTPISGLTWAREVNARAAFGIICGVALDTGFRKVLCTADFLGLQMGITRSYAAGILRTLEKDQKWIRRDGKRGSAIRWRITRLGGEDSVELQERAWLHGSTIDAIVNDKLGNDKLASVLRSVAHPAWHYSTPEKSADGGKVRKVLGAKAWVALTHQFAGLPDDEGLGLGTRALRKTKRELETDLPGALTGSTNLVEDLDVIAETGGAFTRRSLREVTAKQEAVAAKQKLDEFRAARTARFEARKTAFGVLRTGGARSDSPGAIPTGDRDELASWTNTAAAFWRDGDGAGQRLYETDMVPGLVDVLAEKIRERGFEEKDAQKAAAYIFGE